MGSILGQLKPEPVWNYFEEICQIPRPSKKEGRILSYLKQFAENHHFEYKQDITGNILISKAGTRGLEEALPLALQSHVDMVCEKNSDVKHDFDHDPIVPVIEGDWVKAKGTTLGADNGIGMAMAMAVLASEDLVHPPLECLFTVDEETGLTGAYELDADFLRARRLINLDSEDDDELCIGCAGGLDTSAIFEYEGTTNESGDKAYKVQVSGLKGGHSGDDINKGRGNAIKILVRILWNIQSMYEMRVAQIDGGNLRNAIPREAFALITIPQKFQKDFELQIMQFSEIITREQKVNEPNLTIHAIPTAMPGQLIDYKTQRGLVGALYVCPHGVIGMSPDIEGLVETSTNLASVKMNPTEIIVGTSQRSSVESLKKEIADRVSAVFSMGNARIRQGDGYPGWTPDMNSKVLKVMRESYINLFNEDPKVLAVHAGLECGLIGQKYPGMDMISYGPTMRGVHSPDEKLNIASVDKAWKLLVATLADIH